MRLRLAALLLVLAVAGLAVWHAELFTVSRPGEAPRPLARVTHAPLPAFSVTLPRVPVGAVPVASGRAVWLVHYWAPWERHGRTQALALDSLVRTLPEAADGRLRVAIVCFDPFPSVARFVARLQLVVPVLLDHRRQLQRVLPCPSLPWTWMFDAGGRVLVSQPGEVDWHAPGTRELLREVLADTSSGVGPATQASPNNRTPRQVDLPGRSERRATQTRAVAVSGRGNQRASSAWPPKSAAL